MIATSDVPGGVVNLLTGDGRALLPWLADHEDVDLIDLSGAPADMAADLEARAADNLKRTAAHRRRRGHPHGHGLLRDPHGLAPGPYLMLP